MEPHNDSQLSSYYHPATTVASPTNGLLPPPSSTSADGVQMVYSAAAPSAAVSPPPLEPIKRKRGRPRKYGTPEQALAAKKAATTSSAASKERKHQHHGFGASSSQPPYSGPSRKSHSSAVGQGFTPHVITVAAGEDVAQKIMFFMQQNKREICILSASGSISNASLCQPATSGGNVTYEGRFEIITLSGSFVRTDSGGRAGGLSVCLCDTTGQIIGGGVGGPLIAAGPVQVIVGSFLVDSADPSLKVESSGRLASPVSVPLPQSGLFRPTLDSSSPSPYMVQTGAHM